jgi:diguanylate cyclase (GGDEF)-like protein
MLRAGWWIILLTMLAALSVALAIAYNATPMYRATARLIVRPNLTGLGNSSLVDSIGTLDKRSIVATYAEVLNSMRMYNETGAALQLTPKMLEKNYTRTAVVLPDSNILELAVAGPDPQMTARLVNGVGQRAMEYAKTLYQAYNLEFLDPAIIPTEPFSPQPLRDAALAVVLGLVLGSALAILREQLRMPLEALRRRTMFDATSTAFSRSYFYRRLNEELARQRGTVSLGLLHLEGLEGLVETLPAPVLTNLMRRVTRTLQTELRGRDSVGRWDDLTFALLLPATPGTAAMRTLERVHQALSVPFVLDEAVGRETVRLDPHIGFVTSCDQDSADALIKRAQVALERAQHNGNAPVFLSE